MSALAACRPPALQLRALVDADRSALCAHLLGLDPDDRRMRFMRAMSDADIAAHVAAIAFTGATRFACFDGRGAIVALAEGFGYVAAGTACMEVALSTGPAWRRQGLATRLFAALSAAARAAGVVRLVLQCDSRNGAMRRLLASVGAATDEAAGEIDAVYSLAAA